LKTKAFGTFTKKGGYCYRTSAFIQWGDSTESIGATLLLYPGDAKLIDPNTDSGEITFDQTLEQLKDLVERIYDQNKEMNGRFQIYNLFPLTLANAPEESGEKALLEIFSKLYKSGESLITKPNVSVEDLKKHPWILVGWGSQNEHGNLDYLRYDWRNLIRKAKIRVLGRQSDDNKWNYDHPNQRGKKKRADWEQDIVDQYQTNDDEQKKEGSIWT